MNENLLSIEKRSSINGTFWKKRFDNDYEESNQSSSSKLNNILETILYGRNLKKEDFNNFLDPKVNNLLIDPSELFDMDVAVKEITSAMVDNKKLELLVIMMLMELHLLLCLLISLIIIILVLMFIFQTD